VTFRRVLLQWFWDSYDHLVALLLANIALFVLVFLVLYKGLVLTFHAAEGLPPAGLVLACATAGWLLLTPAMALWIGCFSRVLPLIARERPVGWRDFVGGVWENGWRSLRFAGAAVGGVMILLVNLWFYTLGGAMASMGRPVAMALGGLTFWVLVSWMTICVCALPWFFRGGLGVRGSLRRGLVLLLTRPGLALGVATHVGLLWLVGLGLQMVGAFLVSFSLSATFLNSVFDVLEAEANPEEPLPAPDSLGSWKEREAVEKAHERRRMDGLRYNRTLRDVLKPWEG